MSQDAVFRALADPTRRAIFERLTLGEHTVKDLVAHFPVSQPAVSQHLQALRRAGLVAEQREGRFAFYRVRPAGLRPLVDWLAHYQAFWTDHLARLHRLVETLEDPGSGDPAGTAAPAPSPRPRKERSR